MSARPKLVARRYFLRYEGKRVVEVSRPEETDRAYIRTLLKLGWVEVDRARWLAEREQVWAAAPGGR